MIGYTVLLYSVSGVWVYYLLLIYSFNLDRRILKKKLCALVQFSHFWLSDVIESEWKYGKFQFYTSNISCTLWFDYAWFWNCIFGNMEMWSSLQNSQPLGWNGNFVTFQFHSINVQLLSHSIIKTWIFHSPRAQQICNVFSFIFSVSLESVPWKYFQKLWFLVFYWNKIIILK